MPLPRHLASGVDFDQLRAQLKVPDTFPDDVLREADTAARSPVLPDDDATAIALVTLDPPGSRDLDQAVHIAADGDGFRVTYAIADVAAFVRPGGALDQECWRRGVTLYAPDRRTPLHPPVLSEGAASLLPGEVRPAVLWQFTLDADGEVSAASVRRARVRSEAQLDYPTVQAALDGGTAHPSISLLPQVGRLRLALARQRHAIELDLPDQEVVPSAQGGWSLVYREQLPCERWNAEISLMTGISAAALMVDAQIGVLRTLPAPTREALTGLRRTAALLGVPWPEGADAGDVIASVSRTDPKHVAFLEQAAHLLRGAGYVAFVHGVPKEAEHSGVGTTYAHATAPLRRLVDRYVSEVCLSVSVGAPVPQWASDALPRLPESMAAAGARESRLDSAIVDTVEALLVQDRRDETFDAVAVSVGEGRATVVLDDPAVRAQCEGDGIELGARIRVRAVEADPARHLVRFRRVS